MSRRWLWLLLLALPLGLVLFTRSTPGRTMLARLLQKQAQKRLAGEVSLSRLSGGAPGRFVLHDVVIDDAEGREAIRVAELEIDLSLWSLVTHKIVVRELRASGVSVHARRLADGRLNLAALTLPSGAASTRTIDIERIELDGVARWNDAPVELHAQGALRLAPSGTSFSGVVAELRTRELGNLVGDRRLIGEWRVRLLGHGPLSHLTLEAELTPPSGQARAQGAVEVGAVTRWSATLEAAGLDPGAMARDTPRAQIDLRAKAEGQGADLAVELSAQLDARDHSVLAGRLALDGRLAKRGAQIRVDFKLRGSGLVAPRVRIAELDGELHLDGGKATARLEARRLDSAPAHFDVLRARLDGTTGRLHLSLDGRGPTSRLSLAARARPLTAPHNTRPQAVAVTLDRLAFSMRGVAVHATSSAKIRLGPVVSVENLQLASGPQRLSLAGRLQGERVAAQIVGEHLDAAVLIRLFPGKERSVSHTAASLEARVSGTRAHLVVDARLDGHTIADQDAVERLQLQARYSDGRVRGRLFFHGPGRRLEASGALPLSREGAQPIDLTLSADLDSIASLRAHLPAPLATLDGKAHLSARLSGTTRRPALSLALEGTRLSWASLTNSRLAARIDYRDRQLQASLRADLLGRRPAGSVVLSARVPFDLRTMHQWERVLRDSPLDAELQLDGLVISELPLAQLGWSPPLSAGVVSGTVTVEGTIADPRLQGELSGHRLAARGLKGIDATARVDYSGGRAQVALESDVAGAPFLLAHATTTLRFVDRARWRDAPLQLDAFIPDYAFGGGSASAHARLQGSLGRPRGSITARADRIDLGGTQLDRAQLEARFDGAELTATLSAEQPSGGRLRANAILPLDADATWRASLSSEKLLVDAQNLGPLRKLAGQLDAQLQLGGSRRAPLVSGQLHLREGALARTDDPRLYQHVTIDLEAHDRSVALDRLSLTIGGGKLSAHGRLELAGLLPSSLELTAKAEKLPVAEGPIGAWIDADLTVRGQRDSTRGLTGTVTVQRGTLHLPKLAAGRHLQSTDSPKDVVFVDPRAARARLRARRERPLLATIDARVPGPFHLRGPELMTDLDGDLQISVAGPRTTISGSIQTTGGWLDLLGRRWELDRARIGFDGATLDPELDVRLTREVSDAVIAIEVHGTSKKPKLGFSSDPPIYTEPQIIGMVVSGDPGNARVSDRSLDEKVVGALSGVIVSKLKDQLAPALPIDVLKIDTGDTGYTGLTTTRVEVGKYITDAIYVSYVHQFGALQLGTRRLNANEANVEWRFRRRFAIDTMFGDAGAGSLDFFWTLRY